MNCREKVELKPLPLDGVTDIGAAVATPVVAALATLEYAESPVALLARTL